MRRFLAFSVVVAVIAGCTNQPFTVDVSLRVVSISPSGGAEGVGRLADVKVIIDFVGSLLT